MPRPLWSDGDQVTQADFNSMREDREKLSARVARLERFISEESGIINDWAAKKPCGTKMSDWIKGELDRWLKLNP